MAQLRVRNATGVALDWVRVHPLGPGAEPVAFGPLAVGATSEPQEVADLRPVAAIEAAGPGRSFILQPYDVVGEPELPPGSYVYVLSLAGERLALDVQAGDR